MMLGLPAAPLALAQTGAFVPNRNPVLENRSIDEETTWTFRLKTDVIIHSPIVRLGDVVVPLDLNMPGWDRMSRAAVGLVPVDGTAMRVDRERLKQVFKHVEVAPPKIYWVGSDVSQVKYVKADTTRGAAHVPVLPPTVPQPIPITSGENPGVELASYSSTLEPEFADRVVRWIELALDRHDQKLREHYRISIDRNQPGMQRLSEARGVERVEFVSKIQEGDCVLRVISRGLDAMIQSEIVAVVEVHPIAIVPMKSLRGGYRLSALDLTEKPIPKENWDDGYCTDPSELIGLETRGNLRMNEPIHRNLVGKPTLVRRGDLLEVRVLNGAISVTTNAKSLSDGAESELVEIETQEPRKRLTARVVQSGLVEIVTRAPRTQ